MSLRFVLPLGLAPPLRIGSLFAWGRAMTASQDGGALGPNPSNADIHPIENRQLLGFRADRMSVRRA